MSYGCPISSGHGHRQTKYRWSPSFDPVSPRRKRRRGTPRHFMDDGAIDSKAAKSERLFVTVPLGKEAAPGAQPPRPVEDTAVGGAVLLDVVRKDNGDFRNGRDSFHTDTLAKSGLAVKKIRAQNRRLFFAIWYSLPCGKVR